MKRAPQIMFAVILLGVVVWRLLPSGELASDPIVASSPSPRDRQQNRTTAPQERASISPPSKTRNDRGEPWNTNQPKPRKEEPTVMIVVETNSLRQLIPEWLLKQGEVRSERIQVGDGWADRLRSRYSWPDEGGSVEVEVSDLGVGATEDQFKSLGFNFALNEEETKDGVRMIDDQKDYIANLEYNEEDGEGHVQYLVAGRFLMEVQLEGLPLDSFQVLENRHSLIGKLLEHAAK